MTTETELPEDPVLTALRARIGDIRPVRPLAPPWKRAIGLAPLALLMLVAVPLYYGLRRDAPSMGALALWGPSLLQVVYGLGLIAGALREVVPGRQRSARWNVALLAVGLGVALVITAFTWYASPTVMPSGRLWPYWNWCFRRSTLVGLPLVGAALFLALGGWISRPALTGALLGLGAGLVADASWRTFCDTSDPSHVLSAHLPAALALSAIGALATSVAARLRERGRG